MSDSTTTPEFKFRIKSNLSNQALVSVVMGSRSDGPTMRKACEQLDQLGIPWEAQVISAHRTPDRLSAFAETVRNRGIQVVIAGAGGAAHLPGMIAAKTTLPVIGVPIQSAALSGIDSLLSIVQMPGGMPVLTMAIGEPGATNAALAATSILALNFKWIDEGLQTFRQRQTAKVPLEPFLPLFNSAN